MRVCFWAKSCPNTMGSTAARSGFSRFSPWLATPPDSPMTSGKKDVNQVGNAYRKIMNVGIHNLLCGGIPLRCSIKSRAAVHILRLCGQHVQRTFRVGKPCFFLSCGSVRWHWPVPQGIHDVRRCSAGRLLYQESPCVRLRRRRRCSLSAVFRPVQLLRQRRYPE